MTIAKTLQMRGIRASEMTLGGRSIPLPVFYASVSSVKTSLPPVEYLKVLEATRYPHFLVSAYDLYFSSEKKKMVNLLKSTMAANATILMDSGNYESYWREDSRWTFAKYVEQVKRGHYHVALSFDNQAPPTAHRKNAADVEKRIVKTLRYSPRASIIPIIHGKPSQLPAIAEILVRHLRPLMIAVPERELGEGMIARIATLVTIRRRLARLNMYTPIHLLGTGNPLSLLLFSAFGADSFDGLDWCQTAVDHSTGLLFHFQQREFFGDQSPFSRTNIPYAQATLAHNLMFYAEWMRILQDYVQANSVNKLLKAHFKPGFLTALKNEIGRVLT